MSEFLRLLFVVFILFPLSLLLIGPLLVLAALRGVQRIGPIVFEPERSGVGGRILALLLGLTLWLVIWGGLVLLVGPVLPALTPAGEMPGATAAASAPTKTPRPTFTPSPAPPPATSAPTLASQPLATSTPAPLPPATDTPVLAPATSTPEPPPATDTPAPAPVTATPVPIPSPTPVPPTATPTRPPTASAQPPLGTPAPTVTPVATLAPDQAAQAIAVVEKANDLLRAAVVEPSLGNLAALETAWRGDALRDAQAFAQDLSRRYVRPLEVTFVYLSPPSAREGILPDTAVVTSAETWTYAGPRSSRSESFEFTYTMAPQDSSWIIIAYSYHNVPGGAVMPSPTSTPEPITSTTVITP
jgi:hypothetical protein